MQTHKVMKYKSGEWSQVGVVEVDTTGRSLLVLSESASGRLLLHPLTPVPEIPKRAVYNEPPMDFDDDIPFAPIGKQYPAILYCM